MDNFLAGFLPALGRLLISALFLPSGIAKLGNHAATVGAIAAHGLPLPQLGYWVAVIVEIPLALALLLGYRTRLVALVIALYTIVAAIFFHGHLADHAQAINFFKNLAVAGGLIFVFIYGGGHWSIDRWLGRTL
jgi:putative oxidoreductase